MRSVHTFVAIGVLLVAQACTATADTTAPADGGTAVGSSTTSSAEVPSLPPGAPSSSVTTLDELVGLEFVDFLEGSYEQLLLRSPEFLTSLGIAEQYGLRNDRLDDMSPEYLAETQAIEVAILDRLRTYDRSALSRSDQTSYDVYEWWLDQQVRGHRFAYHHYPVHHFVNSYNFNLILFLSEEHPIESIDDADDYVSRIGKIGEQVAQVIERLEVSEGLGIYPPAAIAAWTSNKLQQDLGGTRDPASVRVTRLPLYESFELRLAQVDGISDHERRDLLGRTEAALADSFVPGWVALIDHIEAVRGSARAEAGVGSLPDGDAFYQYLLRDHTSTNLTAAEVHEIGLENVERLEAELKQAFERLGYPDDVNLNELRAKAASEAGRIDGSADPMSVIAAYEDLIDEASDQLRELFNLWPRAPVEIVPEAAGRGGYYVAASVDGSRPGAFHAGVGGAISRYTMPTITYHEAVPGHHTQIAIAQELDLPTFRRFVQYNGFAEGWALYAETLAAEWGGLYDDDPLGNVGRLELELLRAVRLVVDTGIHALGWTRDEARAYMDEKIAGWSHEVERYMVLPGQATGYMIGLLTILDLREEWSLRSDGMLDIADFHDLILDGGSMPLEVLQRAVLSRLDS